MSMTRIPPHVYARIAEAVRDKTGHETDMIEIDAILHDDLDREGLNQRGQLVYDAVIAEGREYGIVQS